ncbi:MAG TPA: hypothetical protein PKA64_14390 [Myxococcota bacterium]|nr:hypothetical protein [Myxococcota bacterium]
MKAFLPLFSTLLACTPPPGDGDPRAQSVQACAWSFSADVREGPSAPLTLAGQALMYEATPGQISVQLDAGDLGVFVAGGTRMAAADGTDLVHLHFDLPGVGIIDGEGPLPASFDDCEGALEGPLVGPQEGDAGDWLADSPIYETHCYTTLTVCSILPRSNAECRNNYCSFDFNRRVGETVDACTERCSAGRDLEYAYYVCDSSGGGGVSTFFGTGSTETCY